MLGQDQSWAGPSVVAVQLDQLRLVYPIGSSLGSSLGVAVAIVGEKSKNYSWARCCCGRFETHLLTDVPGFQFTGLLEIQFLPIFRR